MGLISITDIIEGTNAKANDVNSRNAIILGLVNGNIDSSNIAASAITTSELASSAVTSDKMAPTKSQDANGWTVYDYGTWKEYARAYTITSTTVATGSRTSAGTLDLPVGTSDSTTFLTYGYSGAYAGHAVVGIEGTGTGTSVTVNIGNEYTSTLTFAGKLMLRAIDV